ncbi:hypothetical protein EON65_40320 [archaeon]|nr:MAG: hypothetical protein EON65_40320 [archaeon]
MNGEYGHGQEAWKPVGPCYGNFGNKADLMHHAVQEGSVIAKRDISHCDGRTVYYDDGTCQEDVDVLLLCTGYRLGFPFLPEEFRPKKIRGLYKNIFHPEDPTLAFVGFSRPTQGSIPQLAELVSLFVSRAFAGKIALPDRDTLRKVAAEDCKDWDLFFRYSSGRVTGLVDQILYSRVVIDAMGASFAPLEMLWTYGFQDWLYYLCAPATLHSYLGKVPGKREIFLKFIRENNLFKLYPRLIIGGILYGLYDILFYQIGRIENLYNEVFDAATRKVVGTERVWKESKLEKWWLAYAWDVLTVVLVVLLFLGKLSTVMTFFVAFAAALMVVHFLTIRLLYMAAETNRNFFLERIAKFKWA